MAQHLADDGRNGVGCRRRANGLQIAAGAEGAAFAFDHEHLDFVGGLDLGTQFLEFPGNGKIDGVEGRGAVERDGGDRAVDPQQGGIVGQRVGRNWRRHWKIPEMTLACK